uniref:Uncharacterized protein n=1 Tax=Tetradesmus obliquus TaxID=3088 RepID=A0A383W020_TETOB|eukprot:jgi/Sobl393_1/2155/SZX70384.1
MCLRSILLVACVGLLVSTSRGQENAEAGSQHGAPGGGRGTLQLHPRSDVTGNDLDCGQPRGSPCLLCADVAAVTTKCLANTKCRAFVYNGTCGALKLATQPRVKHFSYTVFIVSSANQTANNTTNAGPTQGNVVLEAGPSTSKSSSNNNGVSSSSNTRSNDNSTANSRPAPTATGQQG